MDNGLYNNLKEKLIYQETLDLDDEGVRGLLTDLLYKESAMKPVDKETEYACGQCDTHVAYKDDYCWHCGQKLDWSEE